MSTGEQFYNDVIKYLEKEKRKVDYEDRKLNNSNDVVVQQIDKVEGIMKQFKEDGIVMDLMNRIYELQENSPIRQELDNMFFNFMASNTAPLPQKATTHPPQTPSQAAPISTPLPTPQAIPPKQLSADELKFYNDVVDAINKEKKNIDYDERKIHTPNYIGIKEIDEAQAVMDQFKQHGDINILIRDIHNMNGFLMRGNLENMLFEFQSPKLDTKDKPEPSKQDNTVQQTNVFPSNVEKVIDELVTTEKDHVEKLESIPLDKFKEKVNSIYSNPFRMSNSKMDKKEVIAFLEAFGEVREAQRKLTAAVNGDRRDPQYFDKIAQAQASMFTANLLYIARYDKTCNKLPSDVKDMLLKEMPKNAKDGALSIFSKPMTRGMRYDILMGEIINQSKKSGIDTTSLQEVQDKIKENIKNVNSHMQYSEGLASDSKKTREQTIEKIAQGMKQEYVKLLSSMDLKIFDKRDNKDYSPNEIREITASFNISEFSKRFNQVTTDIANAAESGNTNEIRFYTALLQASIKENNFALAAALFTGLNNNVGIIKDKDCQKVIKQLNKDNLFSPLQNFKVLREAMKNANGPVIPHSAIMSKDMDGVVAILKDQANIIEDKNETKENKEEARDVLKSMAAIWNREAKNLSAAQQRTGKNKDVNNEAMVKMAAEIANAKPKTPQPTAVQATAKFAVPKLDLSNLTKAPKNKDKVQSAAPAQAPQAPRVTTTKPTVPKLNLSNVTKAPRNTDKVQPAPVLQGAAKQQGPAGMPLEAKAQKIEPSAAVRKAPAARIQELMGKFEGNGKVASSGPNKENQAPKQAQNPLDLSRPAVPFTPQAQRTMHNREPYLKSANPLSIDNPAQTTEHKKGLR